MNLKFMAIFNLATEIVYFKRKLKNKKVYQ